MYRLKVNGEVRTGKIGIESGRTLGREVWMDVGVVFVFAFAFGRDLGKGSWMGLRIGARLVGWKEDH